MLKRSTSINAAIRAPHSSPLPVMGLLALTMTSFIATANEIAAAGLLPQIAQDFGVSQGWAGQLVTFCALGSGIGAIPLMTATVRWNRHSALLMALGIFFAGNLLTAVSSNYLLTLSARLSVGLATGLAWSLLAGYARRMVSPSQQGRALALAMAGIPLALALGMPLSSWLGALAGWRSVFGMLSVLCAILIVWVYVAVADFSGGDAGVKKRAVEVLALPGVRAVLYVVLLWILAHYMLYTYIAPFLAEQGLASHLNIVLLIFGVAAVTGIFVTGLLVDRWLRRSALVSLGIFAAVALMFGIGKGSQISIYLGVAAWGLSFGGAPTLLQTALADTAGDDADVAQSMLVTVFNVAFACSGALGGLLLQTTGAMSIPRVMPILILAAIFVMWTARENGFPAGRRAAISP